MDFLKRLRSMNTMRCVSPNGFNHALCDGYPNSWSELEWAGAMAGEAGETCNAAKKLLRLRAGMVPGRNYSCEDEAIAKIGEEIADTIIYADLLAAKLGLDLETVIREKFNRVSVEIGYDKYDGLI